MWVGLIGLSLLSIVILNFSGDAGVGEFFLIVGIVVEDIE